MYIFETRRWVHCSDSEWELIDGQCIEGDIISLSVADIEAAVTAPPSTRASLVPFKCPEKKSQVHQLYLILSDRRMYIQENLVDQDSLLKICRTTKCATVVCTRLCLFTFPLF